MKQFISIVCIVLMLAVLLVGCSRNNNVSDNTDGKITESTQATTVAPTTERATTERATTVHTTQQPTETATTDVTGNTTDNNIEPSETSGMEGRFRRGLMGGELF